MPRRSRHTQAELVQSLGASAGQSVTPGYATRLFLPPFWTSIEPEGSDGDEIEAAEVPVAT
jgi:hypothetical protein